MDSSKEIWVVIVYDYGEKIASRLSEGKEEDARNEALDWVTTNFGQDADWSFHKVHN